MGRHHPENRPSANRHRGHITARLARCTVARVRICGAGCANPDTPSRNAGASTRAVHANAGATPHVADRSRLQINLSETPQARSRRGVPRSPHGRHQGRTEAPTGCPPCLSPFPLPALPGISTAGAVKGTPLGIGCELRYHPAVRAVVQSVKPGSSFAARVFKALAMRSMVVNVAACFPVSSRLT